MEVWRQRKGTSSQAAYLIQRYLLLIEQLTGRSRDVLCSNAMTFLPFIERLSPAYVDEIRGLADGAGISLEDAVLCQARAEAGRVADGGCTALSMSALFILEHGGHTA